MERFCSTLFNIPIDTRRASTRQECACTKSIDIGAYDTAPRLLIRSRGTLIRAGGEGAQGPQSSWNSLRMDVPGWHP